ncbi:hypothetical protein OSB04_004847 [Centaurea solstitialis]|uniref:BHLH domain-containing protein n=1 Tax=Centaurea solstitialis TaxID=347529 RepID=A0AA38WFU7_9ASTR|nr:hypothetical protein OSB04_004847 [Centaurea solstitialis]
MLSEDNIPLWIPDQRQAQIDTINGGNREIETEINHLTSFKSMLQSEEDNNNNNNNEEENNNNWYLSHQNNLQFSSNLRSIEGSSSCSPNSVSIFQTLDPNHPQFYLPPKPPIFLDSTFEIESGFLSINNGTDSLPEFGELNPHNHLEIPNLSSNLSFSTNGYGSGSGSGSSNFLKPLENLASIGAQPTLFQKRAALRRNSSEFTNVNGGNLGVLGEGIVSKSKKKKKKSSSGGSWDDVDNLSFDGSGLNYDSDDFTTTTECKFGENVGNVGGGGSNGNSTVTGGGGGGGDGGGKGKKKGLPAKNLMAERRRRKKLNDRLYMLRSVVPKISKMDRASILGDAIEYLKELLQRINELNHELESTPSTSSLVPPAATTAATGFYPLTPTATTIPSCIKEEAFPSALLSPTGQPIRIEVRQREGKAVNIHMFCSRRPGLLLSIMRTLDTLGLDIQQAVISCFNGFALDVFRAEQCHEGQDVHPDQIKAMLLESAGYHGVA